MPHSHIYHHIPPTATADYQISETESTSGLTPSQSSSSETSSFEINPSDSQTPERDLERGPDVEEENADTKKDLSSLEKVGMIVGCIMFSVVAFFGLALIAGVVGVLATLLWKLLGGLIIFFGNCVVAVYLCMLHLFGLNVVVLMTSRKLSSCLLFDGPIAKTTEVQVDG